MPMINKNIKYDNTGYGPVLDVIENELSPYIKFSENAYRIFIESFSKKAYLLKNKNNKIFNYLLSNSKNMSFSIRLLSTWSQPIEAYALLRIRLEQLIISSYLLHANAEEGIEAFKKYEPIIEYDLLKANNKNDNLKSALSSIFPNVNLDYEKRMNDLKKIIENSYEIKDGKIKRKWTILQINQLAEERDKLIDSNDKISSIKLLDFYNTIYKMSSSVVHSDIASISPNFLNITDENIIIPQYTYTFTNIIMLAQFDIIQCHEISKKFKLKIEDKYLKLFIKYIEQVKRDFEL
jgi:hypothetical protein